MQDKKIGTFRSKSRESKKVTSRTKEEDEKAELPVVAPQPDPIQKREKEPAKNSYKTSLAVSQNPLLELSQITETTQPYLEDTDKEDQPETPR